MSTIKSSAENLTLNADGANNDIKFQSNGSEVASIDQAGVITAGGATTTGEIRIANSSATSQLYLYGASGQKSNIILNQYGVRAWHIGSGTLASGQLSISDGTTERMRFQHGGVVSIPSGIELGSGVDNTAANTLDDYEEGTWTIVLTGSSSGSGNLTTGYYTKIGRMVHCTFTISNTTFPTFSGNMRLSLPFTGSSGNSNRQENSGDVYFYPLSKWTTGSTFTGLSFQVCCDNPTTGFFQTKAVNTNRQAQLSSGQGSNSGASGMYCRFSVTYTAT